MASRLLTLFPLFNNGSLTINILKVFPINHKNIKSSRDEPYISRISLFGVFHVTIHSLVRLVEFIVPPSIWSHEIHETILILAIWF